MLIAAGTLIGWLAGVGVWWTVRHFTSGAQAQSPTLSSPGPSPDTPPPPAGVPATNPLSPAGGGEGVLSPGAQADDTPTPTRWLVSLGSPLAVVVCLTLAAWGAYVGWRTPGLPVAVGALLVTAVLLAISLVDLRVRRIPNPLVLVLLAWALVQSLWRGQPALASLAIGLFAAGGFFLLLALLTRGAMGLGDVKLAAAIGALVGWPAMVAALFLGIAAGGIAAVVLLLTRRKTRRDYFAYGPYLALGAWVVYGATLGLGG